MDRGDAFCPLGGLKEINYPALKGGLVNTGWVDQGKR